MSNEAKKEALVKLFLCFPSEKSTGETEFRARVAAYLETLSAFSSKTVSSACDFFRRKGAAFPPSAGELYQEAAKQEDFLKRQEDFDAIGRRVPQGYRLLPPPSKRGWTVEQLADWSQVINGQGDKYAMRADAEGRPLRIPQGYPGAGRQVDYGYLTPREADLARQRNATHVDAPSAHHEPAY